MERVFSGIQPTGVLHLGNYLGAVRNWVAIQSDYECIYCVVDLHAVTQSYDVAAMPGRILELATGLLACGLDATQVRLFVQSSLPQHAELAWVFTCVTSMGELGRQTQFKSKSEQQADNINVGLFAYPVLQAADILLYKASRVPVGEDQEQHLELSREIARRFNARFGATFPEPRTLFTSTPRIRGLDGAAKMSKSLGNHIAVDEDEAVLRRKLASAVTDPARQKRADPGHPEICNIYSLHKFFSDSGSCQEIESACRTAAIGCVDCKKRLGDQLLAHFAPIRERWRTLRERPDEVRDVLRQGQRQCQQLADATMAEVRAKMGLNW
ncbi:MAG: tryptophan--tRNA ligase [Proteobacteria bacterium]|nr:tryptophan--tRNA ligase [Pseudomonadota bacterium]